QDIRNVAVIAHVDHGKTTLIDALLKQTHTFRDNQKEMEQAQILDSNDLERERGITILAKNCEINYNGTRINIIDTPGHADFSGEVDRTLGMADGALLIIDAQEGPMPQTRFVLRKALELGLKIIVVINKIDKPNANISRTLSKIDDLFLELVTDEEDLHFPILYAVARDGKVFTEMPTDFGSNADTMPLLDTILSYIPSPTVVESDVFKLPVTSIEYDNHLGRIVIGKIHSGVVHQGDRVILTNNPNETFEITKVFEWEGLGKKEVKQAVSGNIVAIAGLSSAEIGQTVSDPSDTESLPTPEIGEPTLHLKIAPNSSPFAGNEGEFTSSRYLDNRLQRELETNLSLQVEKVDGGFKVSGRGELHLSILLETMRREGFEMEVGKPQVIIKKIDGVDHEPIEEVSVIIPSDYQGVVTSEFGKR
ncbi:GTP-binding protein, partial [candidate division WWE3 bacterium]|nr:GTP-binding protein [candidate division WWE3 bacterium]